MNRRMQAVQGLGHVVVLISSLVIAGCVAPDGDNTYSQARPLASPQYAAAPRQPSPSRTQAAYLPAAPREELQAPAQQSVTTAPAPLPPAAPQVTAPAPRPAATAAAMPASALASPQNHLASRSIERPGVLHASSASFHQQVLQSDVPVLVDFYASWCGPCKTLAPTLDELAAENPGARVVKVDIEQSPDLAARYGVRSVPSLMVFKDGQIVNRQQGVASKARLTAMLGM